ncbi:winged helix-turn-helix domain-containing protein [Thiomicrospira microaerophila]|nr:winged helix-turn-helix domain-containing protein [Thiomicrospira microaerophila]UQB41874.1 winged helix-turn-helix domain-containing protein [Thiomicrospira microaerophila]
MAIPDFQTVMLPVLKCLAGKDVVGSAQIVEQVSDEFALTPEQRAELLRSGKQTIIKNRIGWAITYLKKAGLVNSLKRAHVQLTDSGQSVLAQNLESINVRFLKQFESFREFHAVKPSTDKDTLGDNANETLSATSLQYGLNRVFPLPIKTGAHSPPPNNQNGDYNTVRFCG